MSTIGIVLHHYRPEVKQLVQRALDWCDGCGTKVRMPAVDAGLIDHPELGVDDELFFLTDVYR